MHTLVHDCRICGSRDLESVLDLGSHQLANDFRLSGDPYLEPVPLELCQCQFCETVQITATVCPEELFSRYLWVTGTSEAARSYSSTFYEQVSLALPGLEKLPETQPRSVVEVASNDGTFLQPFLKHGWRILGIEPAENVARLAEARGVPTVAEFFKIEVADGLLTEHGPADLVVARNVVPHVANVHSVIAGLATLAGEEGVVVIEVHSAEVILRGLHYDSIYHEHLCYFSLKTLSGLCQQHGLYPFDVVESPISGGAIVVFLSRKSHLPTERFEEAIGRERQLKTNSYNRWLEFAQSAVQHASNLKDVVERYSLSGRVFGYGASARGSTMLNFAQITNTEVLAIFDQNELKQGRLTPGTAIPVVAPEAGLAELEPVDTVVLLAWNFEDEIVSLLRDSGFRGDVVVPLPREIRVV